jgi:hypothetical protein
MEVNGTEEFVVLVARRESHGLSVIACARDEKTVRDAIRKSA